MKQSHSFKLLLFFFVYSFSALSLYAQIPAGYYDTADGKTAYELKTSLSFIIDNHTDRGYAALWDLYRVADKRADGFLWDIYSNCNLTFGTDQDNGSGGTIECDKYNREHTFPQSWFNSASTPRADGHMVMPTDKKINSERGNFPYGETNGSIISSNGARKGSNIINGYSGTVLEPADEYKGDLARIYFYMATRYEVDIDTWNTNSVEADIVLNGTNDQVYENWILNMLLNWHQNDPVSEKEINRNEDVFNYQGNRNPYIDHPEWVSCIWQNSCNGNPTPNLESDLSNLSYGNFLFGSTAIIKSFTLTGSTLSSSISLTSSSAAFLLSTDQNGSFSQSLSIDPDAEANVQQTIYVKFEALNNTNEVFSESVSVTQGEVNTLDIQLSATVEQVNNTDIILNFINDTLFATVEQAQYEIQIQANKKMTEETKIDIKLSEFTNIFYPAQFTTTSEGQGTNVSFSMNSGDSLATLTILLDTAQLKTETDKSFAINLVSNGNYIFGEREKLLFQIAAYEQLITANSSSLRQEVSLRTNPVNEAIIFMEELDNASYIIYNNKGQQVMRGEEFILESINVERLKNGLYWLYIYVDKKEKTYMKKFMKK